MSGEQQPIPAFSYVTYIRASAPQVWTALTDPVLTARYWGHSNVSDWQPGSVWEHRRVDDPGAVDVIGRVLEAEPPGRLVMTFDDSLESRAPAGPSVVMFHVEQHLDLVRLTVSHTNLLDAQMRDDIARGWPAVLSNLKSLLETGDVLPQAPWEMP